MSGGFVVQVWIHPERVLQGPNQSRARASRPLQLLQVRHLARLGQSSLGLTPPDSPKSRPQPVISLLSPILPRSKFTARFDANSYIPHHLQSGHARQDSTARSLRACVITLTTPRAGHRDRNGLLTTTEQRKLTTQSLSSLLRIGTMGSCCSLNRLTEVLEEGVAAAL
jgi:hypothetical protein